MQPGWPKGLVEPRDDNFREAAVRWLLDVGPGELRLSDLRFHPIALGCHLRRLIEAELDATRNSYARARTEFGGQLSPDEIQRVQSALEAEGARLLARVREVRLVQEALMDHRN